MKHGLLFLTVVLLAVTIACAPAVVKEQPPPETEKPAVPEGKLSPKEQDERAMEVFEEILELTTNPERQTVVARMESLYKEIIVVYPNSQFAPESYYRLIKINLDDFTPPKVTEAKELYKEFTEKYPGSGLKPAINDTIARSYYNNGLWEELLEFCTPAVKDYIKTGSLNGPFFMFLYSEAKFMLGDMAEAAKGYRIVTRMFPNSSEARLSKNRLEDIEKK